MADQEITCSDCDTPFIFSDKDQAFYEEKGFSPPKRCRACRDARKQNGGGGGYSGGGNGGQRGDQHRPQQRQSGGQGGGDLHDAVCSSCGQATQVPFKPKADRPVYCRDCFKVRPRTR